MTQINQNFDKYPITMQQGNQPQASSVRIPNYYYVPENKMSAQEAMDSNPIYQMTVKPFKEYPLTVLGTWLGISALLDGYSKACSGDYEKSLVGKAAKLGDNIQESKFIQNKPVQKVLSGFKKVGNLGEKAVNNSAILRAMKNTPTQPEWPMVITQMYNQKQEVVQEFIKIVDNLKLGDNSALELKNVGITKAEKEMLKKTFNVDSISKIPQEKAVNQVLLNRLGKPQAEINKILAMDTAESLSTTKTEILKAMGLDSAKLKLIKEDMSGKYIDDVMKACEKVKGKVKMGAGHYSYLGPLTKLFERTKGCDEIYNQLYSITKGGGAKTATGRALSKTLQVIHRGLTFGNGKLGALVFIAPILAEVFVNTKKAENVQKVGTFANGLVDNISWVFTFPIALKIMHSIGGIKYAGMSKEDVEKCRNLKSEFNAKLGSGPIDRIKSWFTKAPLKKCEFKNVTEYNIEKAIVKEKIKNLSKVKGQNIFTKGLRKIISILTLDLGTFKSYQNENIAGSLLRKIPNFLRNVVGIPLRFGVWGAISMGVLGAALTKITSSIFGKSYDAEKHDEHKINLNEQKHYLKKDLNDRLYKIAKNKQVMQNQPINKTNQNQISLKGLNHNTQDLNIVNNENIIKNTGDNYTYIPSSENIVQDINKEDKIDNYTYVPSSQNTIKHPINKNSVDNYTYIPSSKCTIPPGAKDVEKQRKYIPSQKAANIEKTFDNSGLQSALDRAQRAEDKALRVLAGNFDGM